MSYEFYKVLHLLGLMLLFFAIGGYTLKGDPEGPGAKRAKLLLGLCHGLGLLILLVAGFGLLAKMQLMSSFPTWAILKILIWLAFGAAPVAIKKTPALVRPFWAGIVFLGVVAAYLAIFKPFTGA
ncbi:MAG: hypothetical protein R3F62_21475 [Planctomycetota bacterium]